MNSSDFVFSNGKTLDQMIDSNWSGGTLSILAEGFMSGTTYLFHDGTNNYVVKYITNTRNVPRIDIEREINTLRLLKGKWFAVQLLAARIMSDDTAYLVFPYIPGKTLSDFFKKIYEDGSFSPVRVESIFNSLLEGLIELHELGIIHRDIKGPNIWIPDDESIRPFLLDFGLSGKKTDKMEAGGTYTRMNKYLNSSSRLIRREPTPNNNFHALGKTIEEEFSRYENLYKTLQKNGITDEEVRNMKSNILPSIGGGGSSKTRKSRARYNQTRRVRRLRRM